MSDLISRQAAIEGKISIQRANGVEIYADEAVPVEYLKALPSAQPEEIALHESCTDCPLYDNDRHRCPRFNKVIPETLRELQSAQPDYTELKREFILMASYIDALLECSDKQKEMLMGFISRLSEHMPWAERGQKQ